MMNLENLVSCVNLVDMDGSGESGGSDRPGESGDSYDNGEFFFLLFWTIPSLHTDYRC